MVSKTIPLSILPDQKRIVESEYPITILNWDRKEGATTGMVLKWLSSERSALMCSYNFEDCFRTCVSILNKMGLEYTYTKTDFDSYRIVLETGQSLDIYHYKGFVEFVLPLKPSCSLWLLDNVDKVINSRDIERLVAFATRKSCNRIVFSCEKGNLGWRHFEYFQGEVDRYYQDGKTCSVRV